MGDEAWVMPNLLSGLALTFYCTVARCDLRWHGDMALPPSCTNRFVSRGLSPLNSDGHARRIPMAAFLADTVLAVCVHPQLDCARMGVFMRLRMCVCLRWGGFVETWVGCGRPSCSATSHGWCRASVSSSTLVRTSSRMCSSTIMV